MPKTAGHLSGSGGGAGVQRHSEYPGSNMVPGKSGQGGLITGGSGNDGSSSVNLVRGRTGGGSPMGKGQEVSHSYIDYEDGVGGMGQGNYPAGDNSPNIVKGSHPNRAGADTGGNK